MDSDNAPWYKYYDPKQTSPHIAYPDISMYEMVRRAAVRMHDVDAYDFFGKKTKYRNFLKKIDKVAAALYRMGLRKGDRVLICMPNAPQALIAIYAISKLGGISVVIHPLSARNEIKFYLNNSQSRFALVMDAFVRNFIAVKDQTPLEKIIVTSIADEMGGKTKIGYWLTKARKVPKFTRTEYMVRWKSLMKPGKNQEIPDIEVKGSDPALILYSGGTTGDSKGILLSNLNLNATSIETLAASNVLPCRIEEIYSDKMIKFVHELNIYRVLSVMPIFHGFGFGVGIHSFLTFGGTCILVPQFTPESYAKLVKTKKPNFIAGVPTLFEKMMSFDSMKNADLSMLSGVFCGGDSLPTDLRERFNEFLRAHGSKVPVKEGYGLTECVTVACLTPNEYRKGSIGIPIPDVLFKIVRYETTEELPYGEEGEICISGPNTMIGYVMDDETTKTALRVHSDGRTWLHTGDAGTMDSDGFVYFRQRYKRIIVSSGYNIYPTQIEDAVDRFPGVKVSCAIGVPDPVRQQRVKVYVVLEKGVVGDEELKKRLTAHCKGYVAAYAVPKLFEFIDEMPMTKIGKIAYREIEEMDRIKRGEK